MNDRPQPRLADHLGNRRSLLRGAAASVAVGAAALTVPTVAQAAPDPAGRRSPNRAERFVRRVFADAARTGNLSRTGDFYDVLADDVHWTVAAWPLRGYTSRAEFLERGSGPVLDRLDGPIIPKVLEVNTDGDTVGVFWEGRAVALDGQPYDNVYHWSWTVRQDRVVRSVAFLDLVVLNELIERVPLPR